jgi:hypothetical protein
MSAASGLTGAARTRATQKTTKAATPPTAPGFAAELATGQAERDAWERGEG